MPSVELIAVGTELLLGQLVDTNTSFVAQTLATAGIDVYGTHAVGDNRERIASAINGALERVSGVVTTGGLGPTVDDLTKEAVCDALGLGTELNEPALRQMTEFFASIGRTMRENNRKQAELPRGSYVLENPNGTAPGFVAFRVDGKFVACMPGVPHEMKAMLTERLIPFLRQRFNLQQSIYTRIIHTINIGESEIDHRIDELFRNGENPKIAVLAHLGRSDVKIMAKSDSRERAEAMIEPLQREVEERLHGHVFGRDDVTIESAIHMLLQQRGLNAVAAESCTGGRIAAALTSVRGSSKSFLGGIVAYDNAVKMSELGVPEAILAAFGAVSEETALAMARGALSRLNADVAVATTGIAGPDGGSPEKPVGLVWFAIASADGDARAWRYEFGGNRNTIQTRATTFALGLLWHHLSAAERVTRN